MRVLSVDQSNSETAPYLEVNAQKEAPGGYKSVGAFGVVLNISATV